MVHYAASRTRTAAQEWGGRSDRFTSLRRSAPIVRRPVSKLLSLKHGVGQAVHDGFHLFVRELVTRRDDPFAKPGDE